jgi:uncharacterized membrane protein
MQRIYYYYVGLTGFFGLFVLLMAWHTVLTPSTHLPKALLLLITVGPLLLPFKGFLNRQLKSCTWMSYLSLPYFIHGVIEAYANQNQRWFSISEILFSLLLCFGAGLYVYKAEKA